MSINLSPIVVLAKCNQNDPAGKVISIIFNGVATGLDWRATLIILVVGKIIKH